MLGPVTAPDNAKLNVYPAPETSEFPEAELTLTSMKPSDDGLRADFSFDVIGFTLGEQTSDAPERGCANSAKGQHIHFILNNAPYKAHYEAEFGESISPGNNVLLAFLSRSYHESLKTSTAALVTSFTGDGSEEGPSIEMDKDMTLFYSRPKGSYKSSDGEKILLDFYLMNCALSQDGHQVRATINDETYFLKEWRPYFVEGLGVGTHTVRLELIDQDGNPVTGPFNDSGERDFTITAD